MGFLKKIFGDAADELKKNFEESRNDFRKNLDEIKQNASSMLSQFANDKADNESKIQVSKPETKAEPILEPIQEPKPKPKEDAPATTSDNDGMFSARLEMLIKSALQDGVLTDQERAIILKRAEKEGEDPDEVEMILNARLAEIQQGKGIDMQKFELKPAVSSPEVEVPVRTSTQQETERTALSDSQEHKEEINSEDKLLDARQLLPTIKEMLPSLDILELSPTAKINAYTYLQELANNSAEFNLSISIFKKCTRLFMESKDNEEAKSKVLQLLNIKLKYNTHPVANETKEEIVQQNMLRRKETVKKAEEEAIKNAVKSKIFDGSSLWRMTNKSSVEVPEGVTIIKGFNCGEIEFLTLPSTLEVIEEEAFYLCEKLKSVDFSHCTRLEKIENSAFQECNRLQSIILPPTIVSIGERAFHSCNNLESVDFSRCIRLERINKEAFSDCNKLKEVILPDCVAEIGENAFNECERIVFPASLKSICASSYEHYKELREADFSKCSLVTKIEESAFDNLTTLESIALPPSIKSIDYRAFCGCSKLESINLSSCHQLEHIGDMAFLCSPLSSLDISKTCIKHIGNSAFSANDQLASVILPDTLVEIGDDAFSACAMSEIIVPDSVKYIGKNAFSHNDHLKIATIGLSAKDYFHENEYGHIDKPIFEKTPNLTELIFKSEVAESTGAKALTKVTFCNTVKEIGKWAVAECAELEEVVLPDSVTKIGYGAFVACENLSSIVLPDSITEIAEGAFARTKLKEIVFPRELQKLDPLGEGFEKLRKLDFSKVTKLKTIPENFIGDDTPKLRELAIPIGVTKIEECIGGENLDRIFLPPTIEEIEELHQLNIDIYCFSPSIEELEPIIECVDEEEEAIRLHVLPEYVESYKGQRDAEGISDKMLIIDVMPEEFRYYYDN